MLAVLQENSLITICSPQKVKLHIFDISHRQDNRCAVRVFVCLCDGFFDSADVRASVCVFRCCGPTEKGNAILNKRRDERIVCPSFSSRGRPSKRPSAKRNWKAFFTIGTRNETSDSTWTVSSRKAGYFRRLGLVPALGCEEEKGVWGLASSRVRLPRRVCVFVHSLCPSDTSKILQSLFVNSIICQKVQGKRNPQSLEWKTILCEK